MAAVWAVCLTYVSLYNNVALGYNDRDVGLKTAAPPRGPLRTTSYQSPPPLFGLRRESIHLNRLKAKLDYLESNPYYDTTSIPINTYHPKSPHVGEIVSVEKLSGGDRGGVYHIVVDHGGKLLFREGQSVGFGVGGINPKTNKPNSARIYSIASTRYGDDGRGTTMSFCIRWSLYFDEFGNEDPTKQGLCSSMLCNAKRGDKVLLSGPTGKILLLPESTPNADIIMVATGTGVAPYRGFVRRLFKEDTPAAEAFTGNAWLLLGVPHQRDILFEDEWNEVARLHPNQFEVNYVLSREMKNAEGGKMYIQHKLKEDGNKLFDRMEGGAHIYFCGLKSMMKGTLQTLDEIATQRGQQWDQVCKRWKAEKRWHVEVY